MAWGRFKETWYVHSLDQLKPFYWNHLFTFKYTKSKMTPGEYMQWTFLSLDKYLITVPHCGLYFNTGNSMGLVISLNRT